MAGLLAFLLVVVSAGAAVLVTRERTLADQWSSPATGVAATGPGGTEHGSADSAQGFSRVYADVSDGIGKVVVDSCSGERLTGSAFLVDRSTMLTAAHVVGAAADIEVDLDTAVMGASVEALDPTHDLALLRLDAPVSGHVFEFSTADPRTGVPVAAIGYPMGEAKTLTVGTVSGLDRDISTETGDYEGLLQTDTAINPGSSGGPVLDVTGQVVAVADAMRTDAQGIGFGVPAAPAAALALRLTPRIAPEGCG